MIDREYLIQEYVENKKSSKQISQKLKCSENKVNYWLKKYDIPKRSISESVYIKANPSGDPFSFRKPANESEWMLYGLGLGLWWGEGNKAAKSAVRLGNTDPGLVQTFLDFLTTFFNIDIGRLRFGLQIFNDVDPVVAKKYWCKTLKISDDKFQKIIVSKPLGKGTYTKKSKYGVLTIYFSNTKLRDSIYRAIEELRTDTYANVAQSVERIHGGSQ